MTTTTQRPIILTGDRTTGPLHVGHFSGSLRNRVALQDDYEQHLLLADMQAMTDNAGNIQKVRENILEVALDYLAVGIDPDKTTICLQSHLPALSELSMLYLNFVSVARLERNPTVKTEIAQRGFDRNIPAGFLCYPAAQAADITAFKATVVPVGADQEPMIEQSNEIVRRINATAGYDVLPESRAIVPPAGRLPGIDGSAKMSKSAGNTLTLSATPDEITRAVRSMYTDPGHIRVDDPGRVEGNAVFAFLDAFDPEVGEVMKLKEHYQRGGLGDMKLKNRLDGILQEVLRPIRERREKLASDPGYILDIIRAGTDKSRETTEQTKREIYHALGLFDLSYARRTESLNELTRLTEEIEA